MSLRPMINIPKQQSDNLDEHTRRAATATPNLIVRSDTAGRSSSEQQQHPPSQSDSNLSWSNPNAFAAQFDAPPSQQSRDNRLRSYPSYGPPLQPVAGPHGVWGPVDPRFPQRIDTTMQPPPGQSMQAYGYPQQHMQYIDPRYGQDVRYYATDIAPGQPFPTAATAYDPSQQSRYRQSTYPFIASSPVSYDQPSSSFAVPQSPARMHPSDFPQVYSRQQVLYRGRGGPIMPVGAPQHGFDTRPSLSEPTPSYPRGPPRKPKQSGFAVWVGNLSPGTTIIDLKDYFSRGATHDIESVFLISKSNCAFVNYKTAESAQAAVSRFHDSRFNGARLVCRLRHGQAPTTTTPPNPIMNSQPPQAEPSGIRETASRETGADESVASVEITGESNPDDGLVQMQVVRESVGPNEERVVERYFIVKSLTLQDLEASVRDGIWATQSHNESALRKAFESAQHVYLIFSANKSGEYFGYARMKSNINPSAVTANPKAEPSTPAPVDGPTSTPTPATEHAPQGRVVDDSARGTIFWEADSSSESAGEEDQVDGIEEEGDSSPEKSSGRFPERKKSEELAKQDWGRPFQIEWMSTNRLPFYRTRGLRNPWNANREVKIARDGTELEPSVGKRLLDLFHQSIPNPSPTTGLSYQMSEGPVVAMGSAFTNSGQ